MPAACLAADASPSRVRRSTARLSAWVAWLAAGAGNASQEELMVKDECILVDEADNVTGHANKYRSHRWGGGGRTSLISGRKAMAGGVWMRRQGQEGLTAAAASFAAAAAAVPGPLLAAAPPTCTHIHAHPLHPPTRPQV